MIPTHPSGMMEIIGDKMVDDVGAAISYKVEWRTALANIQLTGRVLDIAVDHLTENGRGATVLISERHTNPPSLSSLSQT